MVKSKLKVLNKNICANIWAAINKFNFILECSNNVYYISYSVLLHQNMKWVVILQNPSGFQCQASCRICSYVSYVR